MCIRQYLVLMNEVNHSETTAMHGNSVPAKHIDPKSVQLMYDEPLLCILTFL